MLDSVRRPVSALVLRNKVEDCEEGPIAEFKHQVLLANTQWSIQHSSAHQKITAIEKYHLLNSLTG
jgi:hypothetical protein